MQRLPVRSLALAAAAALATGACSSDRDTSPLAASGDASLNASAGSTSGRFMIVGMNGVLPSDLEARVQGAGGRITSIIPEIGVAFAEPLSAGFAAAAAGIGGVESVSADVVLQYTANEAQGGSVTEVSAEGVLISDETGPVATAASLGDDETFYSFQWAPAAVHAPEAWAAGYTGRGARVAILDGAIYSNHTDLAANLDVAASRSFVAGFAYNQDTGTFWHGTHVAGIVAARDNGIGTIGIAPNATLIGVKVLHNGSGSFEAILNGIVYASKPLAEGGAGADVINMSLGATINYRDSWGSKDFRVSFRELQKSYDRATRYANQQGVTVFASTGNDGNNYDEAKQLFKFPAESQHVIAVSSTGPIGWARGATNFSLLAYYSDHGKSIVDVSAPGGNAGLLVLNGDGSSCTVTGTLRTITNPCYAFDMVMSTVRGTGTANYNWSQGTSMASPVAAGIAALVIERSGGTATPAQVRAAIQGGAADLGKPGQDEQHGAGWVNAFAAVQ